MTSILYADNLAALSGVRHAFFTRVWGNAGFSNAENGETVRSARDSMAAALDISPDHLISARQVHSADVVTVSAPWNENGSPQADALVTRSFGVALGILTADCVPILFADASAGVIGAAHAGWKGAIAGVIENTLNAMEKLGAQRNRVVAALGPCIWQSSYNVGAEFRAIFLSERPDNERFFAASAQKDHYLFDLPGYVIGKLGQLGLSSVQCSPADTFADPARFFSHRFSTLRAEKRGGNLLSAIALISP